MTCGCVPEINISIHAPRVGSDPSSLKLMASRRDFNPRSPCGERRIFKLRSVCNPKFQSTLPVWGATVKKRIFYSNFQFFSV